MQLGVGVGEEVDDLGFGVRVVEPDGACVGGVMRVVGDFCCVEVVPAVGLVLDEWAGEWRRIGGHTIPWCPARTARGVLAWTL